MTRFRLLFLATLWGLLVPVLALAAASVPLDRILVIVNGGAITSSALDKRVRQVEQQLSAQHIKPPPGQALRKQVLSRMILDRLQRQYARRAGIKITSVEVDRAFAALAARNQMSQQAFTAALARDGIDVAGFRKQLRTQLTIRQIVVHVIRPRVRISDRAVARYLKRERSAGQQRYHIKDIFVPISGRDAQSVHKAEAQAQRIEARIHKGQAFSELAIAYSQGPEALQGGDLGSKRGAQLPPAFLGILRTLKPGMVSAPLQTAHGFHIIKLVDVQSQTPTHVVTQSHVREILIRPNAILTTAAAEQRAQALRQQIKAGAHFGALARRDSDDSLSAGTGGDLGWLDPGEIDPSIESAVDGLSPGAVSQPVLTSQGVVLVQLLARRQRDIGRELSSFQARRSLEEHKASALYQRWLDGLRAHAYIRYVHAPSPS